ncbi:hypothetical protein [uncultured Dokdonia sp.]|uniref:hypothetical protein n=1 Tax=uncultured Dokdonia sp. TaxID=575653 RepID=UPI00261CBFCF|nr:hypothetical protein [uncultured Dokdonia sp.]
MKPEAIHTEIVDRKILDEIEIIQENSDSYPKGKSNIYAKNNEGDIIWYAELPITGDIYLNSIQWDKGINKNGKTWNDVLTLSNNSFVVSSWNCYIVSIDYKYGKIISKEFTK